MSEPDFRQQQELEEFEMWLDSLEAEKVKELDVHMQRMWQSFKSIYGDDHEREKLIPEQKQLPEG